MKEDSPGEWKGGQWFPNPKLQVKKVEKVEKKKTKSELIQELGEVFHKQWRLKNEVLSLGHRVRQINEELTGR